LSERMTDMTNTYLGLLHSDLLFMIETLMPGRDDREHVAEIIQDDEDLIEAMLEDKRLFNRVIGDQEILLKISPELFFAVLLRRTQKDLERESYTVERRHRQDIAVFDSDRVVGLLNRRQVRHYLTEMLASFTRIESFTVPVRVRKGIWRRYRFNDFDVDSLLRYCQKVDEGYRFQSYKRIADVCLFLTGMFPEYIETQYRYPLSGKIRPRTTAQLLRNREDYEEEGRAFYQLAAGHEVAKVRNLDSVLLTLSEDFTLAEKPLALMAERYLLFSKHELFGC
jgi:hypothetical protein